MSTEKHYTCNKTIDYYNLNATEYFNSTAHAGMSTIYPRFLKYVKKSGTIIDIGAGSGRDLLFFRKMGFKVYGIDASRELCRLASEYSGANVQCCRIQDWNTRDRYDGIWANAVLVHLTIEEIRDFMENLPDHLNAGGVAYVSFKTGITTGEDPMGRFFTNITEEDILRLLHDCRHLELIDSWRTDDALGRTDTDWINIILTAK